MRVKLNSNGYTKIYDSGVRTAIVGAYDNDEEVQEFIANSGVIEPEFTDAELLANTIANFKSLYLGIVDAKLKELDYDSLATVKLWEGDAAFGAEATRILTWYKAIILKNYELLNAGVVLTDAEYLAQINSVVF